jgi:Tfp pilus assembly protein PilF
LKPLENLPRRAAASLSCCALLALAVPAFAAATPLGLPAEVAARPVKGPVTITRPDYGAVLPGPVNERAVRAVKWHVPARLDTPLLPEEAAPETVTIEGPAEATQEQMVHFIQSHNASPKLNCTVEELVRYYYEEAGRENIRPDVALCQAIKETGFFAYGGDVVPSQNNFCGLGTTGGGVRGAAFATPQLGVRAHIQHLLAYDTDRPPRTAIIDPRYERLKENHPDVFGKITRWTQLNGVWAVPGKTYGQEILNLWTQAMAPDGTDASLAYADRKVQESPDEAYPYLYRGIVRQKRAEPDLALKDFESARALAPGDPIALYDCAVLLTAQGKSKDAARLYQELLEAKPDFASAWYNLGLLQLDSHKEKDAIESLFHVLNCDPQNARAQNAIAIAQIRGKKYDAAWTSLARAAQRNNADLDVLANQIILAACLK